MTTTVQLRIDSVTKRKAQKILEELGLDLSSGTKLFLSQVVRSKSIPFVIRTKNGFTPAQEREIIKEVEWTKKYGKRYTNAKEMLDELLK